MNGDKLFSIRYIFLVRAEMLGVVEKVLCRMNT